MWCVSLEVLVLAVSPFQNELVSPHVELKLSEEDLLSLGLSLPAAGASPSLSSPSLSASVLSLVCAPLERGEW